MTPTQSPTLASQATAELPKPAEWALQLAAQAWCEPTTSAKVMDEALATVFAQQLTRLAASFEADRASRAQSEWISVEDERKPVGRKPILVAVQWMNHYEQEDGTPARQDGYDVTEGEYVPQHGETPGHFESYSGPYDHDGWGITHWQLLPTAPATLGETK